MFVGCTFPAENHCKSGCLHPHCKEARRKKYARRRLERNVAASLDRESVAPPVLRCVAKLADMGSVVLSLAAVRIVSFGLHMAATGPTPALDN